MKPVIPCCLDDDEELVDSVMFLKAQTELCLDRLEIFSGDLLKSQQILQKYKPSLTGPTTKYGFNCRLEPVGIEKPLAWRKAFDDVFSILRLSASISALDSAEDSAISVYMN